MPDFGRVLILIGVVLVILGMAVTFADRIPFLKIGKMPGDIFYRRGSFTFYFPLVTSILVSLLLTALLWFFGRR